MNSHFQINKQVSGVYLAIQNCGVVALNVSETGFMSIKSGKTELKVLKKESQHIDFKTQKARTPKRLS